MVVLQVENLHSGWDAENNITHEFSEELCNTLDELVDARACGTETAQLENIVCEAGECNCCWLGVNGEVMFAPQRWRQTTTCVMLTWQKPKALPSTAPCHPCCNTESWRSGRLLGMGHQHKQSCTQSEPRASRAQARSSAAADGADGASDSASVFANEPWTCYHCSFVNTTKSRCSMCRRGKKAASSAPAGGAGPTV